MRLLLQEGETIENFEQILEEYKNAVIVRQNVIAQLHAEIRIIKKLRV